MCKQPLEAESLNEESLENEIVEFNEEMEEVISFEEDANKVEFTEFEIYEVTSDISIERVKANLIEQGASIDDVNYITSETIADGYIEGLNTINTEIKNGNAYIEDGEVFSTEEEYYTQAGATYSKKYYWGYQLFRSQSSAKTRITYCYKAALASITAAQKAKYIDVAIGLGSPFQVMGYENLLNYHSKYWTNFGKEIERVNNSRGVIIGLTWIGQHKTISQ